MSLECDLSGKVAIVTGSSRGLGRAMAKALAGAGADVVITSRTPESLEPVRDELAPLGGDVLPLRLDVCDEQSIRDMASEVVAHFGHVDILVNNAGMNLRTAAVDLKWEEWDQVIDTNLKGSFFCAQAVAPGMLERGWGRIINIGSAACVTAYPNITAYCAGRGGTLQLTKSLAAEWGPHGVTCNVLSPGWFRTDQNRVLWEKPDWVAMIHTHIPVGRLGDPPDLGGAVVYLASEASAYVNGSMLMMDGGFTIGSVAAKT